MSKGRMEKKLGVRSSGRWDLVETTRERARVIRDWVRAHAKQHLPPWLFTAFKSYDHPRSRKDTQVLRHVTGSQVKSLKTYTVCYSLEATPVDRNRTHG